MFSRRQVIAGAIASPWLVGVATAADKVTPPSIEEFLRPAFDRGAALSPDGKRIALLSVKTEGDLITASISLLDADDPAKVLKTLFVGNAQVEGLVWGNDERLLLRLKVYPEQIERPPTGTYTAKRQLGLPVRRIISISLDGKTKTTLFDDGTRKLKEIFDLSNIVDTLQDDPNHVLVQAWNQNFATWSLYKANIYDGSAELIERGGVNTVGWDTQNGVPVIRYDVVGNNLSIFGREAGAKAWTFFRKIHRSELVKLDFEVVGPTREPGVLLALADAEGHDTQVLRKFDVKTLTLGEVVASRPDRDIDGAIYTPDGDLLGASYVDNRRNYLFTDPKMSAHYRGLNKYLDDECNIDFIDISADGNRFLAYVQGPRDAGSYFFYDRAAKRFDSIGQARPWLTPERLASMETLSVKTRDGATITAYLTVPLATGPCPLVVMPHGGPEARDQVDFDRFAQVLAAQGWMVLQPNFRGSGGYGKAFADAGKKHWGDRMQEDVEDAVAQVIASGRIDAARVAICGYSYGGYAALMGAVRRPDLYKAVVAGAGDSDLLNAIAFARAEEGADSPAYEYWLSSIGDPETERAALLAGSPNLHADKIQAPVLLIHGDKDTVVSPKQSQIMAKALKDAGKPVELVVLADTGHSNLDSEDWTLLYTRAIAHISKAFEA